MELAQAYTKVQFINVPNIVPFWQPVCDISAAKLR